MLTFDTGNISTTTKSILLIQNANEQHTGINHCTIQNNKTLQSYMTSTTVLLMPGKICQLTFTFSKLTIETIEKGRNIFKVNNKHGVNDVVLVFLLLTLNKFHTFFWWFYCWLWGCTVSRGLLGLWKTSPMEFFAFSTPCNC